MEQVNTFPYILDLKESGFDFTSLPADLEQVYNYLVEYTEGSLLTDNEKINLLMSKLFSAIASLNMNNEIVQDIVSKKKHDEAYIDNDGFNTPNLVQEEVVEVKEEPMEKPKHELKKLSSDKFTKVDHPDMEYPVYGVEIKGEPFYVQRIEGLSYPEWQRVEFNGDYWDSKKFLGFSKKEALETLKKYYGSQEEENMEDENYEDYKLSATLKKFLPINQRKAIESILKVEPSEIVPQLMELEENIKKLPSYAMGKGEPMALIKYFAPGKTFYATEKDFRSDYNNLYGVTYSDMNYGMAEWGSICLYSDELEINRDWCLQGSTSWEIDLYWKPIPANEIGKETPAETKTTSLEENPSSEMTWDRKYYGKGRKIDGIEYEYAGRSSNGDFMFQSTDEFHPNKIQRLDEKEAKKILGEIEEKSDLPKTIKIGDFVRSGNNSNIYEVKEIRAKEFGNEFGLQLAVAKIGSDIDAWLVEDPDFYDMTDYGDSVRLADDLTDKEKQELKMYQSFWSTRQSKAPTEKSNDEVIKFEVGKTYIMSWIGDSELKTPIKIISRTPKMVTVDYQGKEKRLKIKVLDNVETVAPTGTYSMSPTLYANKPKKEEEKSDYQKELDRQIEAGEIADDSEGISLTAMTDNKTKKAGDVYSPENRWALFQGTDPNHYPNAYDLNRAIEELLDSKGVDSTWSSDEMKFLTFYSGYGGLGKYDSTLNYEKLAYEFYTPIEVVKKMWGLALKYGYDNGSILEPSCGNGVFLKYAPKDVHTVGYEINPYSAKICKILYPHVQMNDEAFEYKFIKRNQSVRGKIESSEKFDLVIGNPPYGDITGGKGGKAFALGEDTYTKATNYIDYFMLRGLDSLESGGLLVMVIGAEVRGGGTLWLDKKMSKTKQMIIDRAELLDAYRLPNSIFERTGVISDIIVLKKK